jgi:hypothetical protein
VELEADFELEAMASAEGGFKFLMKVGGQTTASQAHKVKLIFSPLPLKNPSEELQSLMETNKRHGRIFTPYEPDFPNTVGGDPSGSDWATGNKGDK